jgi:uncharacterized protein YcbK (DUF882 family)
VPFLYFKRSEFDCSETGENEMDSEFIARLDLLRGACGFPFKVNSGYRSPQHSIEAAKDQPGQHSTGRAADIAVSNGEQRFLLVSRAIEHGFAGIGVAKTYIHLDARLGPKVMWTY